MRIILLLICGILTAKAAPASENILGRSLEIQRDVPQSIKHLINYRVRREALYPENSLEDLFKLHHKAINSVKNKLHQIFRRQVFSTEAPEIIIYYDEKCPIPRITILSENGVPLKPRVVHNTFADVTDRSAAKIHEEQHNEDQDGEYFLRLSEVVP